MKLIDFNDNYINFVLIRYFERAQVSKPYPTILHLNKNKKNIKINTKTEKCFFFFFFLA